MIRMTKGRVIILWTLIIVSLLIIFISKMSEASDNGLGTLFLKEYQATTIPAHTFVTIHTEAAWHTFVKFHFPTHNPKKIYGIALRLVEDGKVKMYICVPFFTGKYDGPEDFMETIGHEYLHIVDYTLKRTVFDPDAMEKLRTDE